MTTKTTATMLDQQSAPLPVVPVRAIVWQNTLHIPDRYAHGVDIANIDGIEISSGLPSFHKWTHVHLGCKVAETGVVMLWEAGLDAMNESRPTNLYGDHGWRPRTTWQEGPPMPIDPGQEIKIHAPGARGVLRFERQGDILVACWHPTARRKAPQRCGGMLDMSILGQNLSLTKSGEVIWQGEIRCDVSQHDAIDSARLYPSEFGVEASLKIFKEEDLGVRVILQDVDGSTSSCRLGYKDGNPAIRPEPDNILVLNGRKVQAPEFRYLDRLGRDVVSFPGINAQMIFRPFLRVTKANVYRYCLHVLWQKKQPRSRRTTTLSTQAESV